MLFSSFQTPFSVKEYWEGFDAAQAEEEEGRVTNFTGRKEII